MNDALYLRAVGIAAAVQPDYSFSLPAVRALARMGRLRLEKPVTFLVGENGTGKSTLLEAIAAAWGFNPEGGTRNFRFSTARTHAELYRSLVLQRGPRRPRDGFSFGQKAFTMLRHRKRSMQIFVILPQSIMRNPMGRASWHLHRTIFEQMDCISLMSRRRHCLHSGSLHC